LNKEELCKNCYANKFCKLEKDTCDKCKKKVDLYHPCSPAGYGTYCYCKECYQEFLDIQDKEEWQYATSLLKLSKIHCIKCCQEITYKDISNTHTCEYQTSFKCSKCQFEFTLYHGEYDDSYQEYDYEMEKEAREYQDAMKSYEKALKEWRVKYKQAEQKRKETGEPMPREIWDWRPHKPLTREEKELKRYYINKYGEW